MKKCASWLLGVAVMATIPVTAWAQGTAYPITVIAPGKGPYTFPAGYQTPWEKIEIRVTQKMSPNLFVLHGSEGLDPAHPDASGGRAMVLFGADGVLMVDTENRQVAEKTLTAIRSFTTAPIKVLVNTHIHSDHTGANAFFGTQGAVIFSQENLRSQMLRPPPRANGQPAPEPDMAGVPVATYSYNPSAPGQPAVTLNMNGETVDFIPMMPSHTAGDTIVRFRTANVIYTSRISTATSAIRSPIKPTAAPSRGCSMRLTSSSRSPAPKRPSFRAMARWSRRRISWPIAACWWTSWRR